MTDSKIGAHGDGNHIHDVPEDERTRVWAEVDEQLWHSGGVIREVEAGRRLEALHYDRLRGEYHLFHLSNSAVAGYLDAVARGDSESADQIFNAYYHGASTLQGRHFNTVDEYERARIQDMGAGSSVEIETRVESARRQREAYGMPYTGYFEIQSEAIARRNAEFYDRERQRLAPYGATPDSTEDVLTQLADRAFRDTLAAE